MRHHLVGAIEQALGWSGPDRLGGPFTQGSIGNTELLQRLLTPYGLLDLVMRRSLSTPQLRCFHEGSELHPNRYYSDQVTRRGQGIRMADMRYLKILLEAGCTLVLDELNAFDPTLEVACRALQWWSREIVQVNAYLTTGEADGFDLHWDDHDVVIVQLAGAKDWEVRGVSRSFPMYRDAESNNEPSEEILWTGELATGGVLHIPRGHWHRATRKGKGEGFSLHVTFGFTKRTGVTWLTWLADMARRQELFRHDLDRWNPVGFGDQETGLIAAVGKLAETLPPQASLAARERERPPGRHVPHLGMFGRPTGVVCVAEFPPQLAELPDGDVEVVSVGRKFVFAGAALPALRLLLSGEPVNIGAVAQEMSVDVAQLADALIEEALCAELIPELSLGYIELVPPAGS
jgi:cupin superfamily protein